MSTLSLCDNKLPKQLLHRCSKTCDWMGVSLHPHQPSNLTRIQVRNAASHLYWRETMNSHQPSVLEKIQLWNAASQLYPMKTQNPCQPSGLAKTQKSYDNRKHNYNHHHRCTTPKTHLNLQNNDKSKQRSGNTTKLPNSYYTCGETWHWYSICDRVRSWIIKIRNTTPQSTFQLALS